MEIYFSLMRQSKLVEQVSFVKMSGAQTLSISLLCHPQYVHLSCVVDGLLHFHCPISATGTRSRSYTCNFPLYIFG